MHPLVYIVVTLALIAVRWCTVRKRSASAILWLGILCLLSAFGVFRQYICNVGPDDWGAATFVKRQLFAKTPRSVDVLNFEPDKEGSISGVYHIRYDTGGLQGVIPVYYDGITKKFSAAKPTEDNQVNSNERRLLSPHDGDTKGGSP